MAGYKTLCPACNNPGRNLYVTPENGMRYCFNCRYTDIQGKKQPKERYYDVQSIRSYYTELTEYYHSCLEDKHRLFLHTRGITDATIVQYRLGFVPDEIHYRYHTPIAKVAGMTLSEDRAFLGGRIVFPYYHTDGLVWDIRGRSLEKDAEVRYLSPKGSAFFRGADNVYNVPAMKHKRYVITEGEIKALLSQQYGVPCIAFPGMNSIRTTIQREDQQRVLCFDNQITSRKELVFAIKHFAYKVGTYNLYVATLLLKGEQKQDIDSYILRYGIDAYKDVIDRALPYEEWSQIVTY